MKHILRTLTLTLLLLCTHASHAQCTYDNRIITGSEVINYNLYFNWKFFWVKVGSASMVTKPIVYGGSKAFSTRLVTRTSAKYDKYFRMRDTILSYYTPELTPIYYRKGASEGKRYYVDEVWYTYPQNRCQTKVRHLNTKGKIKTETSTYDHCVSDMLHCFQRIRNMKSNVWKPGFTVGLDLAGGSKLVKAKLVYKEKKKVKADDDKKYDCLVVSYIEYEDNEEKEIARFFVTDDDKHIPIRLDLNLRFGTAKAFFTK